jgi:hypothetical protein
MQLGVIPVLSYRVDFWRRKWERWDKWEGGSLPAVGGGWHWSRRDQRTTAY